MPYEALSVDNTAIAAAQTGALSKLYHCASGSIGSDNATALGAATEVLLSSKRNFDLGASMVALPGLQATKGITTHVSGNPEPSLSFSLTAHTPTTALATELNLFKQADALGTTLWLACLTGEKTVAGVYGLMGEWMIKLKPNLSGDNEIISYDVEAKPAFTVTHLPQPIQILD